MNLMNTAMIRSVAGFTLFSFAFVLYCQNVVPTHSASIIFLPISVIHFNTGRRIYFEGRTDKEQGDERKERSHGMKERETK